MLEMDSKRKSENDERKTLFDNFGKQLTDVRLKSKTQDNSIHNISLLCN